MDKATPVRFGGFKGMDNIHSDNELPHDVLRRAINVDVLDSGLLERRDGSVQSLAASLPHSLWSDGVNAYFILANQLRKFFVNGTSTLIGNFAAGSNWAAYTKVNAEMKSAVYVTCKTARGRLSNGILSPWGVEVPASPPSLAASVGTMGAGIYYAVVTYLLADGRESGASDQTSITLAIDGGIATVAMPNPLDAAVTKKRLYLTKDNGDVFYMAAEVGATDQFTSIGTYPAGAQLRTAHLSPPPFGIATALYNGRIFIIDAADPRIVWYTETEDYDHVDTRKNYYQFGSPVTVIAAAADGLYICSDQTYFLPNAGSVESSQRVVLEFGAEFGSAAAIPNTANVIWMTSHGPAVGKDGGVVELIAEKAIAPSGLTDVAAMVREKNGLNQYVIVGGAGSESAMQSSSYTEAEVVRRSV